MFTLSHFRGRGLSACVLGVGEPGIVNRARVVDAPAVLQAREYWDVEEDWLVALLPAVRRFLQVHGEHGVRFGDSDDLNLPYHSSEEWFDWLMEAGFALEELPRYCAERLAFVRGRK